MSVPWIALLHFKITLNWFVPHTFPRHSDLADSGFLLLLGVRLRYDEGENANSSEEDDDLQFDELSCALWKWHWTLFSKIKYCIVNNWTVWLGIWWCGTAIRCLENSYNVIFVIIYCRIFSSFYFHFNISHPDLSTVRCIYMFTYIQANTWRVVTFCLCFTLFYLLSISR